MPFTGFICNVMKSHEHRTRDLLSCFARQYMLIHLPSAAIPQPGKHGHVGPALRRHNLQLERAKKFFSNYTIPLSEFAMPAGIRQRGGFVALVMVDQSSRHCLKEFKDNSGGFDSWERKLLIGQDHMKEGVFFFGRTNMLKKKAVSPHPALFLGSRSTKEKQKM